MTLDQLRALGYAIDTGEEIDPSEQRVTGTAAVIATPGYFLFNSREPPSAQLVDQTGRLVHSWSHPGHLHWSNVELLRNGDLLVPGTRSRSDAGGKGSVGRSLTRLSWEGQELWSRAIEAHHDVEMTPTGDIAVLTYRMRRIGEINPETDVKDVSIVVLNADGVDQAEHSL